MICILCVNFEIDFKTGSFAKTNFCLGQKRLILAFLHVWNRQFPVLPEMRGRSLNVTSPSNPPGPPGPNMIETYPKPQFEPLTTTCNWVWDSCLNRLAVRGRPDLDCRKSKIVVVIWNGITCVDSRVRNSHVYKLSDLYELISKFPVWCQAWRGRLSRLRLLLIIEQYLTCSKSWCVCIKITTCT